MTHIYVYQLSSVSVRVPWPPLRGFGAEPPKGTRKWKEWDAKRRDQVFGSEPGTPTPTERMIALLT